MPGASDHLYRLLAVVSLQIQILDLAHQRIPGVRAGALIVKCLLHHSIQRIQEVLLIHAVVLDAGFHTHGLFQLLNLLDELQYSIILLPPQILILANRP